MKPKKGKGQTPDAAIEVTKDELSELVGRINSSDLSDRDKKLVSSLVATVLTLRTLLDRRTGRLISILRKIFGLKTESRAKSGRRPDDNDPKGGTGGTNGGSTRRGGQGRNGKDDYPGAKKIAVAHECLKPGDTCPACAAAGLAKAADGIAYRWSGQAPLVLTLFLLERLLCQSCKTTYTAAVPGEARDLSGLDPSAPALSGAVKERAFAASAAAAIASMRFEMGVPHFRLAEIQAQQGVPLAPATQYKVMDEAFRKPAAAVVAALERAAGGRGELFINDDTGARIMEIERAQKKAAVAAEAAKAGTPKADARERRKAANDDPRKKVQTSAIVARLGEHTICLYYTGHRNAGENLARVLDHRDENAPAPMQMCDGLSGNQPTGYKTLLGNCLDHARRKYNDVKAQFPDEVSFVLDTLGLVYKNDAEAKAAALSPEARLAWHQEHSAPLMAALESWAKTKLAEKEIEPNGTLGGAVSYMLKRWTKLTAFLREAGMPLSSAEVERLIKRCIRHRKNSLHYKTQRGAELGDMLMSLIQTCRYARESTLAYLTALAASAPAVCLAPDEWLPWNYRQTLAALAPA